MIARSVETWFIGPSIGGAGVALAWIRGRQMNRRLAESQEHLVVANQRLERLEVTLGAVLARHVVEQPEDISRERAPDLGLDIDSPKTRQAIGEAIARLPEREKLAVTLYYYEELTQSEIAEVLGVSQPTVSKLLQQAILRLKSHLSRSTRDELDEDP